MEIDTRVTPGLHPQNIEAIEGYNDDDIRPYLGESVKTLSVAYDSLGKIHTAREQVGKTPTMTDENKLLSVADFANKHMTVITKTFDRCVGNLNKSIDGLEQMMNAPVESDAEKLNISGEVRNFARGLSLEDRIHFLNEAIKNKDVRTLRAVLGAPAYLSGMSEIEQRTRTREYHRVMQPQIELRLQALTKARDILIDRSQLVFTQIEKAQGGSQADVKKIREAHNRAHDSMKFDF